MSAEPFYSLGGFSVGIPQKLVVDSNGNVVTNVLNLSGNVAADKVYANSFFYANGQPFTGGSGNGVPGGSNSTVQFNNLGNFGGSATFTFDSSTNTLSIPNVNVTGTANLGSVDNLIITGGNANYVLTTDGAGNLSWAESSGGGNGTPGGSNTQLQFNDDGTFGGSAALTFDKDTDTLTATTVNIDDLNANSIDTGVVQVVNSVNSPNISVSNRANVTGNLRVTGNVNFTGSTTISLGTVSNVKITGGVNGYVLTTDGLGNLSWQAGGGSGGNGVPAGSNTQVQFNNNGLFGASPFFTFNNSTNTVQIGGNLIANTFQMGAGVYKFSTSEVYFATTASTSPRQVLYSIPTENISGVEFHIIATDAASGTRQSSKISSVVYNGQVQFNEYAGLYINGGVGTLEVDYNAGNIITPPALELLVSPDSSSQTVYKMLITVFAA
jgi:hypothetical protein